MSITLSINSEFNTNTAIDGGAIWSKDTASKLYVNDSEFTSNNASNNGGAIWVNTENIEINDSIFIFIT